MTKTETERELKDQHAANSKLEQELKRLLQQSEADAKQLRQKSEEIFRLQTELADTSLALSLAARLNSGQHERKRAKTATIHTHWRYAPAAGGPGAWASVEKETP